MGDTVRIQGNPHDWGSTIFKIASERYFGFSSIGWGEKRNRKPVFGSGRSRRPRGQTNGKYEPGTIKIKGEKAMILQLKEDLARLSASGRSYGDPKVPIVLQYIEYGQKPITEAFYNCAFISQDNQNEDNEDPITDEVEFTFEYHTTNGLHLYEDESL
jgi:hypothetical protein